MKIGIIGAGNVGTAIGRRLAAHGHTVMLSFARSMDKVVAQARTITPPALAGTPLEAASMADVIVFAPPWAAALDVAREIAPVAKGKVMWDTTNPLKPDMSGLVLGTDTSGGEEIERVLPEAKLVKAVPPMAELLASDSTEITGRLPGVFACGDDAEARATVLRLVADIGADGVDAGPLTNARYTEPLGMLLVQLAYVQGMGPRIGSSLLREVAQ